MSIRLRFTLVYSAILALTLVIFGTALFSIQSQTTLESLKKDLIQVSDTLGESVLKSATNPGSSVETNTTPPEGNPPESTTPNGNPPPPMTFQNFSSDQSLQQIPEREMVRVLDTIGNLVASPYGKSDEVLPLSAEGLQTLQNQQVWWQTDIVMGKRMLIYSRPIVSENKVAYILQVARPLTERDSSLQTLGLTLILASLVMLAVAFAVGWWFSGFVMKPIKHITQTANSIGEQSDFSKRVLYKGPQDEVGQLATTFNLMLTRLEDSYQQVRQALEQQRNFVADVSHELRTPLTTLRGNLELLRRIPAIPEDEKVDIQNDLVTESDRLIRLVNELLNLARADASRNLAQEKVILSQVFDEISRQVTGVHPDRTLNFLDNEPLSILADRDAIKQILLILVDNALKYTRGDIDLSAQRREDEAVIKIIDHGEGIPQQKLEHLFDRFYRIDKGVSVSGFGLGLAIAKSLAEAQGGQLEIMSEIGVGSQAVLHFQLLE